MTEQIQRLVRQAGGIVLTARQPDVFEKEGHANFVTQTDIDVQAFLVKGLKAVAPNASILAEEKENEALGSETTFVIDPIDGTINFMRDRRFSAISVAVLENRAPVLAFVYQPWADELYFAKKDGGAFLNGRPLRVSAVPFAHAIVNVGTSPYRAELSRRSLAMMGRFLAQTADIRRLGSAELELCQVAAGRADVFCELELSAWDYAAGALVVTEAGGRVSDLRGQPLRHGVKTGVLAANPLCFAQALEVVRETEE